MVNVWLIDNNELIDLWMDRLFDWLNNELIDLWLARLFNYLNNELIDLWLTRLFDCFNNELINLWMDRFFDCLNNVFIDLWFCEYIDCLTIEWYAMSRSTNWRFEKWQINILQTHTIKSRNAQKLLLVSYIWWYLFAKYLMGMIEWLTVIRLYWTWRKSFYTSFS